MPQLSELDEDSKPESLAWLIVDLQEFVHHSSAFRAVLVRQLGALDKAKVADRVGLMLIYASPFSLTPITQWRRLSREARKILLRDEFRDRVARLQSGRLHRHLFFAISKGCIDFFSLLLKDFFGAVARKKYADILSTQLIRGLHLSRFVVSESLRESYQVTEEGEIRRSSLIYRKALRLQIAARWLETFSFTDLGFYSCPEPSYTGAALARLATSLGLGRVTEGISGHSIIQKPEHYVDTCLGREVRFFLPPADYQLSEEFPPQLGAVRERLETGSWKDLPYLGVEPSSVSEALKVAATASDGSSVTVVWLHDFADGELMLGWNSFDTLLAWAQFTIDELLRAHPSHFVVVKFHPNEAARQRKGNVLSDAAYRLASRYLPSRRVFFLQGEESNQAVLKTLPVTSGVTYYGTVAEELAYWGIPSVASHAAPYGGFGIANEWRTRSDYRVLLSHAANAPERLSVPQATKLWAYLARRYPINKQAEPWLLDASACTP